MELSQLSFRVSTQELLDAKKAIDSLAKSMHDLNSAQLAESKGANAVAKAKGAQATASNGAATAMQQEVNAQKGLTASGSKVEKLITNLRNKYSDLANGMTSSESTILNLARTLGATENQMQDVVRSLQQIGTLTRNPFDASLGAIRSMEQQLELLEHRTDLATKGIALNARQLYEYGRIATEVTARLANAGVDLTSESGMAMQAKMIQETKDQYAALALQYKEKAAVEKDVARSERDRVNSLRYLADAEQKAASMVATYTGAMQTGDAVTERSAASVAAYTHRLKLAGITGEEASRKLAAFSAQQKIIASQEQKQREAYLTRALIPQFSDLFVGLTTGQNPLTVALQQLPQIQDLFTLTGVRAEDTVKVIGNAASEMFVRLKGTASAVFQAIGLGFVNLGKQAGNFFIAPAKVMIESARLANSALETFKAGTQDGILGPVIDKETRFMRDYIDSVKQLGNAWLTSLKVMAVAAGVIAGVLLVALAKVISATTEMNKNLITQGALLGLSSEGAIELANSFEGMGISVAGARQAVGEFAGSGIQNLTTLESAIKSAIFAQQSLGIEVKDTAKEFANISKDPVKALLEIGKETGFVNEETIKYVAQLKKQGKEQEAVNIAQSAYIAALTGMSQLAEENLTPIERLWRDIKKAISDTIGAIQETADNFGVFTGISKLLQGVAYGAKVIGNSIAFVGLALRAIKEGDIKEVLAFTSGAMQQAKDDYLKALQDIDNAGKKSAEQSAKTAAERQKNALAALGLKDIDKPEKKTKADPVQNYYAQVLERISDLNVKNTGTTQQLTKAEQLLLDVRNDPKWKTISETQRQDVENRIKSAKAIEIETKAIKDQKDLQEELLKIQSDYQLKAEESLNEIKNKTALIGLTEEQKQMTQALLKVEQERRATIEKINAAANKKLASGADILDVEGQRISSINKINAFYELQAAREAQAVSDYQETANTFETGWKEAFNGYTSAAKNSAEIGKKAFESMTNGMADALTEWAMTGKITVRDFANTFIREMIRMQMQQAAAQAVGGIGGLFTSLVGSFTGSSAIDSLVSSGDIANIGQANTGFEWSTGGYTGVGGVTQPAGIVHKGEVVWSQQDVARAGGVGVVEAMRKGLKGYANGGLVSPSYGTNNSASTKRQSDSVSIEINNYSGEKASAQESVDSRGNRRIEVTIGDMVASEVRRSGSGVNSSIRSTFSTAPNLVGR